MVQHVLMYIYFCQWTFWMGQNMDSFIYLLMMYKGPFNKNCYFLADKTMFCFLFSFQAVLAMFLFCSCVPHASAWYRYFLSTFEPVGCLVSILQVWQLMIYIYIYTVHTAAKFIYVSFKNPIQKSFEINFMKYSQES